MVTYGGIDLGVVGVSEGNGHPYSFSAIVNGYSNTGFEASDWSVIHDYLRRRDDSEFGFPGVEVTHAWTQSEEETERLCEAAKIPNRVSDLHDLIGIVDGLLLLRDDHENHYEMALPFLKAGTPVFVDKPLSMDIEELRDLRPYLENGMLMSCSGMRYARELDGIRCGCSAHGDLKLIRGAVINDWEHYGVHLLDAIFNVIDEQPITITPIPSKHFSVAIELDPGPLIQVDTLGEAEMAFDIDVYGANQRIRYVLQDNFTAFRRTIWRFIQSIRTGQSAIHPEETVRIMNILMAGRRAHERGEPVDIIDPSQ